MFAFKIKYVNCVIKQQRAEYLICSVIVAIKASGDDF